MLGPPLFAAIPGVLFVYPRCKGLRLGHWLWELVEALARQVESTGAPTSLLPQHIPARSPAQAL